MTKEEAAKWAELYKAYAEGKIIQVQDGDGGWNCVYEPHFDEDVTSYRVKPGVKTSVGYRKYLSSSGSLYTHVYIFHETCNYSKEDVEDSLGFQGWIDAEWQYAVFEENT